MATYWVSTAGTDTNSGTNYANAKKTIDAAFGVATSQGDKVYIVNDGTHLACGFSGKKLVSTGNAGTAYGTDPGFAIIGVDSSGNPAMATVAASNADGRNYFLQTTNSADYIEVEGIFFDWTSAQENSAAQTYKIIGYNQAPDHLRIRNCRFRIVDPGAAWVDVDWWYPVSFTDSGNGTGQVEISYCFFENCGIQIGSTNGQSWTIHHNVLINDSSTIPSGATYMLGGGVSFAAGNVYRFYNNTLYRQFNAVDDTANMLTVSATDSDGVFYHSNLYYNECGTVVDGQISSVLLVGQASGSTGSTATLDYNHFGFNTNYNSTSLFGGSAGYTSYTFYDTWRAAGTPNVGTVLNSNDTQTFLDLADFFNSTSPWTWSTTAGYEIELPLDMRPTTGRTTAFDGGPAGAITEAVNAPPTAGNVTYTATSGVQKTVNSTLGVLSNASDPDGDTLSASLVTSPSNGVLDTFNTTTGAFEYTPNLTYTGTDTFTFKVSDGTTFSSSASAIITVSNQTPVISGTLTYSMTENQVLSVSAASGLLSLASDADVGQTLSVTGVTGIGNGVVVENTTTGAFVYTPNFGFVGTDLFGYYVTDGNTNSALGAVTIQVTEAAPVVPPETITNLIDTAPFFRPTLEVQTEIRFKTKKNRRKHHDLADYTEDVVWEESTHRIVDLSTNTSSNITLGGVASAAYLMVETDNPITVSVNGTDTGWPVSGCVIALVDSVTSLYLTNSSTTLTAQVILSVVD